VATRPIRLGETMCNKLPSADVRPAAL
jgi:hypothetical protein